MREYEKDVDLLVELVEMLSREVKALKRKKYYRKHKKVLSKVLPQRLKDLEFEVYGKVGRKVDNDTPKEVRFD